MSPRGRAEYVRVIEMAKSGTDLLLAGATPWKRYKVGRTLQEGQMTSHFCLLDISLIVPSIRR